MTPIILKHFTLTEYDHFAELIGTVATRCWLPFKELSSDAAIL